MVSAADVPSLTISQLKITSSQGQFITLYNATDDELDLSKYQLEYFNHYDLAKATSRRLITLSGKLPSHGYHMVNDSSLRLCYQLTIESVSLGLSSTAGMVQVQSITQSGPGQATQARLQDYVSWSKSAAAGVQTLPVNTNAFLLRQPVDVLNHPIVLLPGEGSWQTVLPDETNSCNFVNLISSQPVHTGLNMLLPTAEPPAQIIELSAEGSEKSTAVGMPPGNIGLMAPTITELLPNPDGTGNDDSEEFIELYNPNPVPFDLSGFSLKVGMTGSKSYSFVAGTLLPPRSFKAFYSETTAVNLSNTNGMVKLLDPFGNSIAATEPYNNAKDAIAWALASGKWRWTTTLTPNSANIIREPAGKKTAAKSAAKKSVRVQSSKNKLPKSSKISTSEASNFREDETTRSPIHTRTLVLVAGSALLYGAYEYRKDFSNRLHQLRRYFKYSRGNR